MSINTTTFYTYLGSYNYDHILQNSHYPFMAWFLGLRDRNGKLIMDSYSLNSFHEFMKVFSTLHQIFVLCQQNSKGKICLVMNCLDILKLKINFFFISYMKSRIKSPIVIVTNFREESEAYLTTNQFRVIVSLNMQLFQYLCFPF